MKVIAMGYSGTGSSAIVQLLSEYNNCSNKGLERFEHVVFYAPHGLFDLEDAILRNNSLYRSDAALNDFYTAMKRLNDNNFGWFGSYRNKYGKKFMEIVDRFIERLTTYTREGSWFNDYKYEESLFALAKDTTKLILHKPVREFGKKINRSGDGIVRYSFVNEEQFYMAGKEFINDYFNLIEPDDSKILVLDQLILPQHLYRINNYFNDDIRFIVLDRDPRDMYILSKYVWSRNNSPIIFPDDPKQFIDFYCKFLKTERIIDDERILRIHFEDLIYNYDEIVCSIENFVGKGSLGEHTQKMSMFNPMVSIKNTQNFRIDEKWTEEVSIIETEMANYLYDFPYEIKPKIEETSDP